MTIDDVTAALASTLADHRLSRSERGMLLETFGAMRDMVGLQELRRLTLEVARSALADPADGEVITWLEGVLKLFDRLGNEPPPREIAEAHFSPGDTCCARIVQLIANTRRQMEVCVFTITDDRISRALLDADRRGVAIRIVTDNEKAEDEGSDIAWLRESGIPVRVDRTAYHMHHKFAVFDGELLLSGSYNWTRGAALYNDENLIVTGDRRLISAFSRAFEQVWDRLK